MSSIVEGIYFHIFILLLPIFFLISDDIRYLCLPTTVDEIFITFNESLFIVFLIELALNCLYEKNFCGTFNFYLDILALLSVVTEVRFIWGPIATSFQDEDPNVFSNEATLQRVNYASNTSSA
jgi:hypothetical protein